MCVYTYSNEEYIGRETYIYTHTHIQRERGRERGERERDLYDQLDDCFASMPLKNEG